MNFEPFDRDLVRAHQRDLEAAADGHRLAESARPGRPALFERLRLAVTLARLARGARRNRRAVARPSAPAAPGPIHELCRASGS
jgi:hypothetical protein